MKCRPDTTIAYAQSGCESVPLSAEGLPVQIENDHFVGSVFFAHTPSAKRGGESFAHVALLEASGSPWEIQIQGRFKTKPCGQLYCGGELSQRLPMGLGGIMKSMCRVILTDVTIKPQKSGTDVLYTPIIQAYRLFRSEAPIALPIFQKDAEGTWEYCDGEWLRLDRTTAFFDTDHFFAFSFNSPYIDFERWTAIQIPGIGSVDLGRFSGNKGFSVKLFDEAAEGSEPHCFMDLKLIPPSARRSHSCCGSTAVSVPSGRERSNSKESCGSSSASTGSPATDVSSHSDSTSPDNQQWDLESDDGNSESLVPEEMNGSGYVSRPGSAAMRVHWHSKYLGKPSKVSL